MRVLAGAVGAIIIRARVVVVAVDIIQAIAACGVMITHAVGANVDGTGNTVVAIKRRTGAGSTGARIVNRAGITIVARVCVVRVLAASV